MSCKLDPRYGHVILVSGFLVLTVKEVHGKPRLYVSFLEYGRHVEQLRRRRLRRRRAYAPTSNTAKENQLMGFLFSPMMSMGLRLAGQSSANSFAER